MMTAETIYRIDPARQVTQDDWLNFPKLPSQSYLARPDDYVEEIRKRYADEFLWLVYWVLHQEV